MGKKTPDAWSLRHWLIPGLLSAIAVFAYAPSFSGVFVYDDIVAIVENPNIRALWPLSEAMSAPPESPVSARPVAALTLAINHALAPSDVRDVMSPGRPGDSLQRANFLRNVWGYHAMNLLLHVLTALALAGVVRRTLLTDRLRDRFESAAQLLGLFHRDTLGDPPADDGRGDLRRPAHRSPDGTLLRADALLLDPSFPIRFTLVDRRSDRRVRRRHGQQTDDGDGADRRVGLGLVVPACGGRRSAPPRTLVRRPRGNVDSARSARGIRTMAHLDRYSHWKIGHRGRIC